MKKQSKLLLLILGSILIFSGCTAKKKETASIKKEIPQATKKEMEQWVNDNQGYIADTMTRKYAGDLWKGLGLITKRKYTGSKLWKPLPKKN